MRRTGRRLAAGLAAIALAAAGWTAFWHYVAGTVLDDIGNWKAEREADGWTVDLGAVTTGGFPLSLTVRADALRLAGPAAASPWQWDAPGVTATLHFWDPGRIAVSAPGTHRLAAGGRHFAAELAGAEAVLTRGPDGIDAAEWTISAPVLTGSGRPVASAQALDGGIAVLAPSGGGEPGIAPKSYGFAVRLQALELPAGLRLPPGGAIDLISVEGAVRDLPAAEGPLPGYLEAWREGGGVIELRSAALEREPLNIAGNGTFALDRDLQPEGAMTVDVAGIDEMIGLLKRTGAIDSLQELALRAALALGIGGSTAGDGRIRFPVSLQERTLRVGSLRVLKLPPVRWE